MQQQLDQQRKTQRQKEREELFGDFRQSVLPDEKKRKLGKKREGERN